MGDAIWPMLLAAVLAVVVVLLLVVIWSIRRHRAPDLELRSTQPVDQLVHSLAGLSLGTAVPGNSVELLENGAFFDTLEASIGAARHSVHFETFLWKDGELGRRMANALSERARAGVSVRVDGHEAFVGGHCIVDTWLGNAEDGEHFADVSLRLRGPVVHSVQSAFSENWTGRTGELFVGEQYFPALEPAGDVVMHAAFLKPEGSAPAVKILHHTAILVARKRIWIQNPYFIPEPAAIVALGEAVARGVDVRVLMPSTGGSDMPMVQHAGHRNFEWLLRCGVRLFEYPDTLLHQKVMTVDGTWSAVGSSNFDDRSFEINDEIMIGIRDEATAQALDAIFEKYAARAVEIQLDAWRRRGLWHRIKDNAFYALNEFL
jgi:cardiolipin synthase